MWTIYSTKYICEGLYFQNVGLDFQVIYTFFLLNSPRFNCNAQKNEPYSPHLMNVNNYCTLWMLSFPHDHFYFSHSLRKLTYPILCLHAWIIHTFWAHLAAKDKIHMLKWFMWYKEVELYNLEHLVYGSETQIFILPS